jgi:hypothetical protein
LKIVKYFEGSGYKVDSNSMMMYLVIVTLQKGNIPGGLRSPAKLLTNYQAITKRNNATPSIISKEEDKRIIGLFENQAQWLSYFTITNE